MKEGIITGFFGSVPRQRWGGAESIILQHIPVCLQLSTDARRPLSLIIHCTGGTRVQRRPAAAISPSGWLGQSR